MLQERVAKVPFKEHILNTLPEIRNETISFRRRYMFYVEDPV
jgi:hypothetical protein